MHHADMTTLPARLIEFTGALRTKGFSIGTSETIDAAQVINVLGLADRSQLREGLAAALVRKDGQRPVFDAIYDIYFPLSGLNVDPMFSAGEDYDTAVETLRDRLSAALVADNTDEIDRLAKTAVELFGPVSHGSGSWSAHQTLQLLAPQQLIADAAAQRIAQGPQGGGSAGSGGASQSSISQHQAQTARENVRALVQFFRQQTQTHARSRTAQDRGLAHVVRHGVATTMAHTDFLSANADQLAQLRRSVGPLARKLATRLNTRRQRHHRGRVDIRRTIRKAAGTGGVPMSIVYQRPRPTRPELVVMCDVSGSVAGFSQFTMLLIKAISDQFSRVRVFAFVNAMAEVTDLVSADDGELLDRIHRGASLTRWHSSSDYGSALGDFWEYFSSTVTNRSTVLILGDGRNNNQDPNFAVLNHINQTARRVYWLNPERESQWGVGDSMAHAYQEFVQMIECRNLEQLSHFVSRLMPVK